MVASETKAILGRFRSFGFSHPMFVLKPSRELTCVFVTVCILMSRAAADEQDFREEFLKREYSLSKPYRGEPKFNCQLAAALTRLTS